jgi:aminomethyltransferase
MDGQVINDPLVLKVDEDRLWFSIADRDLELWAKSFAAVHKWDVSVKELEVPVLAVQGPKSTELLSCIFGTEFMEDIKFYNFKEVEWHGIKTLVLRAGWSPERGYELYPIPEGDATSPLPAKIAKAMWDDLVEAGRPLNVSFGGPHQGRRLEGGMLSSCDYEVSRLNALELGLPKFVVNLDMEHNFVGKDALMVLRDAGAAATVAGATLGGKLAALNPGAKRLVAALAFDTEGTLPPMSEGWVVRGDKDDSGEQGLLTSLGHSPRVGKFIALASVPAHLADPGTQLLVETPRGTETATVTALPFPGTESPLHRN